MWIKNVSAKSVRESSPLSVTYIYIASRSAHCDVLYLTSIVLIDENNCQQLIMHLYTQSSHVCFAAQAMQSIYHLFTYNLNIQFKITRQVQHNTNLEAAGHIIIISNSRNLVPINLPSVKNNHLNNHLKKCIRHKTVFKMRLMGGGGECCRMQRVFCHKFTDRNRTM